ncbi:MAG: hypothetical protein J0H89_03235 [Rhizobiales bacterium]|nr:hypothetical protein [Hyphomicrobiales bacterium]
MSLSKTEFSKKTEFFKTPMPETPSFIGLAARRLPACVVPHGDCKGVKGRESM